MRVRNPSPTPSHPSAPRTPLPAIRLLLSAFRSPASSYRLPAADFRVPASRFRLASFRFPVSRLVSVQHCLPSVAWPPAWLVEGSSPRRRAPGLGRTRRGRDPWRDIRPRLISEAHRSQRPLPLVACRSTVVACRLPPDSRFLISDSRPPGVPSPRCPTANLYLTGRS